jgi:hypothetical protein
VHQRSSRSLAAFGISPERSRRTMDIQPSDEASVEAKLTGNGE